MTAQEIVLIISAVFLGAGQLLQMYLSYKQGEDAKKKVEEVKNTLLETTTKQDAKLEEIHIGVNGMNKMIEQAGFARGVKSEVDKEKGIHGN